MRSLQFSNNSHTRLVSHQHRGGMPAAVVSSEYGAGLNMFHQKLTNADLPGILQKRETQSTYPFTLRPLPLTEGENHNDTDHQSLVLGCGRASALFAYRCSANDLPIGINQSGELASVLVDHSSTQPKQHMLSPGEITRPKRRENWTALISGRCVVAR